MIFLIFSSIYLLNGLEDRTQLLHQNFEVKKSEQRNTLFSPICVDIEKQKIKWGKKVLERSFYIFAFLFFIFIYCCLLFAFQSHTSGVNPIKIKIL